jgi:uracil-DNA glycosylase
VPPLLIAGGEDEFEKIRDSGRYRDDNLCAISGDIQNVTFSICLTVRDKPCSRPADPANLPREMLRRLWHVRKMLALSKKA